jgi:hypothetical protein
MESLMLPELDIPVVVEGKAEDLLEMLVMEDTPVSMLFMVMEVRLMEERR